MNDKTPVALDRLLDQVPVGQAPISDLLAAGHAAKRRQRRTLLGGVAAATVLILGGGTIATQALSGSNGQSDNPVADRSPGTVSDLQVRVESGVADEVGVLADDMSGAEFALWRADSQSVIYVSDHAYSSSCPPTASAHVATDGGLTLKIRDYDGPDDCTDDAGRVTVFMDGLTQAPATLTIDDKAKTRTLPITNTDTSTPDGTHRVGIGQVTVAVPNTWDANNTVCNTPKEDAYFFPYPQDCGNEPDFYIEGGHTWVAITSGEFTETGTRIDGLKPQGEIGGHEIVGSGVGCRTSLPPICTRVFGVPDLNAYFTVHTDAPDGEQIMSDIRNSLTLLEPHETTVPFVASTSEQDVVAALEDAGLTVEIERATCPINASCVPGVTDVTPAVGSVVATGSTVTVTTFGPSDIAD